MIGAGVVGVACARALQQAGHGVILFDPAPPGSGCSFGNAGHIALDHIRPLARPDVLASVPRMVAAPLGPLALRWRGVPALPPWLARFGAAARPRRVPAGTAALAGLLASALPDWQAMLAGAGLSGMLRQEGALVVMETAGGAAAAAVEGRVLAKHGVPFQDLSGAEVRERVPGLAATPAAGRAYKQAAHVANPFRLVQALAERVVADGAHLLAAPVTGFRRNGPRIAAVLTPGGDTPVDAVILTAGLGSPALARQLGLNLPMTAERGYHAMLPLNELDVPMPVTFSERGFVITPMEHGIRLAGTVELGAGHQHLGLTLAAVTARLVAALLSCAPPGHDIRPFDPARFSSRLRGERFDTA